MSKAFHTIPGPQTRWWGLPLLGDMRRDYLGFCTRLKQRHGEVT
jgi:hypothetical protein